MRTYKGWFSRKQSFDILNQYSRQTELSENDMPQTSPNFILIPPDSSTHLIIEKGI